MKRPWSVTTTVRNPERLIGFLRVLCLLDGKIWDDNNQLKYQILLIQYRLYGYGQTQFYSGLPKEIVEILNDSTKSISYELAERTFKLKNYTDPPMRGRQSLNPLKKLGFVYIENNKITITELGKKIIAEEVELGDAFLRCFLKWQIPNPTSTDYSLKDGYNANPFICTLHMIDRVNKMERKRGNKPIGLSKREFALFVPSLVNFTHINDYVNKIRCFRDLQVGLSKEKRKEARDKYRVEFAKDFLGTDNLKKINYFLNNLADYGDNAIRYFRLTRLFCVRGNGFYVDLEKRRKVEIDEILKVYTGESIEFLTYKDYTKYLLKYNTPQLPWESRVKKVRIVRLIIEENTRYEKQLGTPQSLIANFDTLNDSELDNYIIILREKRLYLQEILKQRESQSIDNIKVYIDILDNIFTYEDRPILLEKYVTLGLFALNDAISIRPNYPVGDDNEPTFTAPAGVPDIECFYDSFNAICEVTMLNRRDQWYNEGQPVMRHLRDFENRVNSKNIKTYCLFIAPSIHRDTLNTFWLANKYEYEGIKQKIIPMTISQFVKVLGVLLTLKRDNRRLSHSKLLELYSTIIESVTEISSSIEWLSSIENSINNWINNVLIRKSDSIIIGIDN
ncbi:MAG: AlwI family type II restriction endonuclease [Oscillospiraceae bacterium]|jgi:hypothetical protein|nr:AlwI family type II restriction endonuclease [Oscillospiraceae bacterium]